MIKNLNELPANLPRPQDDGGSRHLTGMKIPAIDLQTSSGEVLNLVDVFHKPSVLFIFPRAGSPLEPDIDQDLWDQTPGARGCTPQSCGFRDLFFEFKDLGFQVFGLSRQTSSVLKEIAERNHLPFLLISDSEFLLTKSLQLPTFVFEGQLLIKRMALVIKDGVIQKVFYPVFPPNQNAEVVLNWLHSNQ